MLCCSQNDHWSGRFVKQEISMALQIGNAACVLEQWATDEFEESYHLNIFKLEQDV